MVVGCSLSRHREITEITERDIVVFNTVIPRGRESIGPWNHWSQKIPEFSERAWIPLILPLPLVVAFFGILTIRPLMHVI
jgi:hypothetical protein